MQLSRKIESQASDKKKGIEKDQMYCLPLVEFLIESCRKKSSLCLLEVKT